MTEEEYQILDPEIKDPPKEPDVFDRIVAEAHATMEDKLQQYGLTEDMDIEDEDARKLAISMIAGNLDETLAYLRDKYVLKNEPEGEDGDSP